MPRAGLDTERVVDAAARSPTPTGLDAVTLARVAGGLGVRAPSLYNHVDGRAGLLRALALRGVRELTAALRDAAVGRSGADALAATARAYRAYAQRPSRASTRPACAGAGARRRRARAAAAETIDVVYAVLRGWHLEGDDAVHAARTFRSAVHGFVVLEAAGGFGIPLDLDASFERLVATLAGGLATGR